MAQSAKVLADRNIFDQHPTLGVEVLGLVASLLAHDLQAVEQILDFAQRPMGVLGVARVGLFDHVVIDVRVAIGG
jgi:hypothetical protein